MKAITDTSRFLEIVLAISYFPKSRNATGNANMRNSNAVETPWLNDIHVARDFLNNIGKGNSTTIADVERHCIDQLGRVPDMLYRWLKQQTGGEPINGVPIENPKYKIDWKSGKITVLRLHISRRRRNK